MTLLTKASSHGLQEGLTEDSLAGGLGKRGRGEEGWGGQGSGTGWGATRGALYDDSTWTLSG